jgi:hypothetical protein
MSQHDVKMMMKTAAATTRARTVCNLLKLHAIKN